MYVIFDMNYIASRTAFAISPSETFLSTKEDRDHLRSSIFQTLNFIVKKYHHVSSFVFCFDSSKKSWRYDLGYGDAYKATRREKKTEPRFCRSGFLEFMSELYDFLDENKYCVMRYDRAEGDDLIFVASNMILQSGNSVMICTADSDMKQLVRCNGKNHISMFNLDSSKMIHYIDRRVEPAKVESIDDFLGISTNVAENGNLSVISGRSEKIIPEEMLFVKVLSGDKSDNIPSVFKYQKGKSEMSFTDLRAKRVFEKHYLQGVESGEMTMEKIFEDENLARHIMDEVLKDPDHDKLDEIRANIKMNRRYIELGVSSYDDDYFTCLDHYVLERLMMTPNNMTFDRFIEDTTW